MGQHKIAAHYHGQKPTTHKPRIGQFNRGRSNYLYISAEIVANPMKAHTLNLLTTAKGKLDLLRPDHPEYAKTNHEVASLAAQYNVMPDHVAMKGKPYRKGQVPFNDSYKGTTVAESDSLNLPRT